MTKKSFYNDGQATDSEKRYERFWLVGVIIAAGVLVFKQKAGHDVLYLNR